MQYRLKDNLGLIDARHCNKELESHLEIDQQKLRIGCVIDLSPKAAAWLLKKYPSLIESIGGSGKVRGEAKQSELTAPDKQ